MTVSVDSSALRAELSQWFDEAFDRAGGDWLAELEGVAPYATGELVASGRFDSFGGGPAYSGEMAFDAPQALWTDEGTKPHQIVGNPLLAFEWQGRTMIVHSVNHPGTPATLWWSQRVTNDGWASELDRALTETAPG